MKIDRIEAFAVGNPWKNWLLVRVSTDQGHTGWGEATTGLTTMPAFAAIGEIARLFIGRDPRDIQRNWQDAHKALYLSSDGVIMAVLTRRSPFLLLPLKRLQLPEPISKPDD